MMAGAYCTFCGHRCFVERWVPGSILNHLATCSKGMKLDRERLGHDHTTAYNPRDPDQVEQYKRLEQEGVEIEEQAAD